LTLSWWDIPGPARFVRRVEGDLRDRVNVVAALPAGMGQDWFDFFRRHWAYGQERMHVLQVDGDDRPPLDILCEAYTTNPPGTTTIGGLVGESAFQGQTVGVLLKDADSVRAWADFLVTYERECRRMDPQDRATLLVATDGVEPRRLPSAETLLRVHLYDGYARTHDCFAYAWALLGTAKKQAWRTELKLALCAQLAQWDHRLCEELAGQDIGAIIRKDTSINALPVGQGERPDNDAGWALGVLQRWDGKTVFHSGWVARDAASREFEQRVWTAQVQVIFPLIEQLRQQAIDIYGGGFPMPVQVRDRYGNIRLESDPYELEIADVHWVMREEMDGVPPKTIRRIGQARDFRNALAHLEPLDAQQLHAFEPMLD